MSSIKNVGVVGASGNVGAPTTKALLDAGFTVTAISRTDSKATFPEGVLVKRIDITSLPELTAAFTGLDAVVSTISPYTVEAQNVLADAALAAGVKRYIPSEFGVNTRQTAGSKLAGFVGVKTQHVDYIKSLAEKNPGFTWTGITTGAFFEWVWKFVNLFEIDPKTKTATIYDSGNERFGATVLADVGRSVALTLQNLDKTKNRYIAVQTVETSQNEILAAYEKLTGVKLTVVHKSSKELEDAGIAAAAQEGGIGLSFISFLKQWTFADGGDHANKADILANADIGLKQLTIEETLKTWIL